MRVALRDQAQANMPAAAPPFDQLLTGRHVVLTRGAPSDARTDLLDWDGFLDLILTGQYPPKALRVTRNNGEQLLRTLFIDKGGIKADNLKLVMAAGASLVAYGLDPYAPALGRYARDLCAQLRERVEASAVATCGPGGALDIHFDRADVFVMQIEGRKRWIIYPDPAENPFSGATDQPIAPKAGDPTALDTILEPGDTLFVPGGYWHHCQNMGERSLHAALLFWPLSEARILDLLYRQAAEQGKTRAALRGRGGNQTQIEDAKAAIFHRLSSLTPEDIIALHQTYPMPGQKH